MAAPTSFRRYVGHLFRQDMATLVDWLLDTERRMLHDITPVERRSCRMCVNCIKWVMLRKSEQTPTNP